MNSINSEIPNSYKKNEILQIFQKYIHNGIIGSTSGDTYDVNQYSQIFGDSELSQGFLLMLLSTNLLNLKASFY